ncbi:LiaF domain-containing protein [Spirochaeta cellobiosiphila]|uniref:LiaF domain-containing protein n=1 Tax=Spirochaeta cellobiosiphila TaxID=504483 RepID=UPI00040830BC|nr:LiaF domain-containing protein [Spirochaeta cellobiosiphila]
MEKESKYITKTYRDQVASVLSECFSHDYMDVSEFERRHDLLNHASTKDDLDKLIIDAPQDIIKNIITTVPVQNHSIKRFKRNSESHFCIMGSQIIKGDKLKAQKTSDITIMGESTFDLRGIELPLTPVNIDLVNVMGKITIIVPHTTEVDIQVANILGSTSDKTLPQRQKDGGKIIVQGICVMGEITVMAKN